MIDTPNDMPSDLQSLMVGRKNNQTSNKLDINEKGGAIGNITEKAWKSIIKAKISALVEWWERTTLVREARVRFPWGSNLSTHSMDVRIIAPVTRLTLERLQKSNDRS